jgi:hypothetical protein
MFTRRITFLVLLMMTLAFIVGCGPSQDELDSQVNAAVAATLTAVPTYTPYATQTAYPTHTPYPTTTSFPTYTPYPTYTPEPSDTPTATFTPEPTATPTATLAPTRAENVNTGGTAALSGDLRTQLLTEIDKTRAEVEEYSYTITPKVSQVFGENPRVDLNIDCQAIVYEYDNIADILVLDVASSDPVIQNAYNLYITAVNQFKEIAAPWTDGCRESLANGELYKEINLKYVFDVITAINAESTDLLRQAIKSLQNQ